MTADAARRVSDGASDGASRDAAAAIADLFVALLRRLEERPEAVRALAERHEAEPARVRRSALRALDLLEEGGAGALAGWVDRPDPDFPGLDSPAADDLPPVGRALVAAQAIDAWHAPLAACWDPAFSAPASSGARLAARRRYNRQGRFNSDAADGQVILRAGLLARSMNIRETTPPVPFDVADLFQTLLLVPPSLAVGGDGDGGDGDGRRVALAFRRVAGVSDRNPADPAWTPVVGVVPLAEAEADIAIRPFVRDGESWYDPVPRALGRTAAAAIDALAAQGANLILFPEASVHPETLDAIKAAVRRHAVDGPIRCVLAAVKQDVGRAEAAGCEPVNRVVILDRTGTEIATQAKLHGWDLDADQCRSYGLCDGEGRPLPGAREYIVPGDRFTIVELPDLGRLAVTICEDLGRAEPSAWIGRSMMVDWLVTPVMDGGLTTERWQAREGAESSRAGYCRVVVANSMALSHRFNRARRAEGREGDCIRDCGVALLFQPRADSDSAPRVACLTLPLEGPEMGHAETGHPGPGFVATRWEPEGWPELKADRLKADP